MWTSMLGHKFTKEQINSLDKEHLKVLKILLREPANACCAECAESGTSYASVTLGVFLCVRCADVHRALGTHISKIKGCNGMDLWGPDEIDRMREVGNKVAEAQYGMETMPAPDWSKEQRIEFCKKKYEEAASRSRRTSSGQSSSGSACGTPTLASRSDSGGDAKALFAGKRRQPNPLADTSADDLFKDFEMPSNLTPKDLLHGSSWWVGAEKSEKMMDRQISVASTVASSEAGSAVPSPAKGATAIPLVAGTLLQESEDIWDDFGAW